MVRSRVGCSCIFKLLFLLIKFRQSSCRPFGKKNTVLFCCSSCTEDGTTAKKCEEILLGVFAGQTHVLKGFHHFLAGRDPFHDNDSQQSVLGVLSFLAKVKVIYTAAPCLRFLLGVAI